MAPSPTPPWALTPDELPDDWLDQVVEWIDAYATDARIPVAEAASELAASLVVAIPDDSTVEQRVVPWRITNERDAEWAAALYAAANNEHATASAQAMEWHGQIDDWLTDRARRPAATAAFFRQHLEMWALAEREANPKGRATFPLPSAVVRTQVHADPVVKVGDRQGRTAGAYAVASGWPHDTMKIEGVYAEAIKARLFAVLRIVGRLSCGHEESWELSKAADAAALVEGAEVHCVECAEMGVEHDTPVTLAKIIVERWIVVDANGSEVAAPAGFAVDPPHISASVKAVTK